jgi:hypothetical protein
MRNTTNITFAYLVLSSLLGLVIAYIFGNDGFEAFVITAIALALLMSWQVVYAIRLLFTSNHWFVIKLFGSICLLFFWFTAIMAVLFSVSSNIFTPQVSLSPINWPLVLIGTLPFLLPRISKLGSQTTMNQTIAGIVTSFYSILILYIAVIAFYANDLKYQSIVLVMVAQLQYLMSHVVVKTDYIYQSHAFAKKLTHRTHFSNNDTEHYLVLGIVGLPFLLPLAVILLISAVH